MALLTTLLGLSLALPSHAGGAVRTSATETPPSPGATYLQRKADYLQICSDGSATGGLYGQLCRLATNAGSLNETAVRNSLAKINAREDTADFHMAAILRMLTLFGDSPTLSPSLKAEMVDAVLRWKYWLDEPGPDTMCWWSENHQVLFHSAELVAGQLFPDEVFSNSGLTGAEHVAHALPLLETWMERRMRWGFSEFKSNIYYNEDMPALLNVADLAEDPVLAGRAAILLDVLAFDFANGYYQGVFATPHGRTYESTLIGGSNDSTTEAAWLMTGLGQWTEVANFTGSFLATSPRYFTPALVEGVARRAEPWHEGFSRDGINLTDGPGYGLTYADYEDVMFWWGMGAYAAPPVIEGTLYAVDYYDLWDDFFWSDAWFLEPLVGSPLLEPLATWQKEISAGAALEQMNAYVWRTPSYQLSGAQNFKPGYLGAQAHIWQATLDPQAVVFTTYPGGSEDDYAFGAWTGGWLPRASFHQGLGVISYDRPNYHFMDGDTFTEFTHAYFPRDHFDEITQQNGWTFGRKGESWIALYSHNPTQWAADNTYELIAEGHSNMWIVELGSSSDGENFASFVTSHTNAPVAVQGTSLGYTSPRYGNVTSTDDTPLTVNGDEIFMGPYPRWSNAYTYQEFDTRRMDITLEDEVLTLDFDAATRSVVKL